MGASMGVSGVSVGVSAGVRYCGGWDIAPAFDSVDHACATKVQIGKEAAQDLRSRVSMLVDVEADGEVTLADLKLPI